MAKLVEPPSDKLGHFSVILGEEYSHFAPLLA
jgi:hypothetical protein